MGPQPRNWHATKLASAGGMAASVYLYYIVHSTLLVALCWVLDYNNLWYWIQGRGNQNSKPKPNSNHNISKLLSSLKFFVWFVFCFVFCFLFLFLFCFLSFFISLKLSFTHPFLKCLENPLHLDKRIKLLMTIWMVIIASSACRNWSFPFKSHRTERHYVKNI